MSVQPLPVLAAQRRHLVQLGALMGLWPAWMGAQGSGDAVVRLVSHGDESGPNKPQYLPWIAGAKAVFERANRDRSLGATRIELIHRDTGGKKDASIELTKKSLAEDNAHAFFGFGGGPVLEAVLPLMTEARMPMIGSFTGAETTRGASPYMFHTRPAFNVEVEYVVRHMATLGYKKVAVVAIDRPIGTGGLAQIGKIEHTLGLTWQKLSFKQDLSDMETVTTAITNGQTQACLVLAPSGPGTELIKRCKSAGYTGAWYGLSVLSSAHVQKVLGEQARGIVVSQAAPLPNAKVPMIRDDFAPLMAQTGIKEPQVEHVEGYIAARTMLEVLKRCNGRFDPATIYQAAHNLPRLDLGGVQVDFAGGNRNGSNRVFISLISRDGKLVS